MALYALLRLQAHLPWATGHPGVSPGLAFNTAVSFTTNTSWQNYAGEATLGHLAQATGLGVQAFASAAVGLAAGLALIRGLAPPPPHRHSGQLLGRPDAQHHPRPAAPLRCERGDPHRLRRRPEPGRPTNRHDPVPGTPDHPRRTGRLLGTDQTALRRRRRLVQRQQRPPLRKPHPGHQRHQNHPDAAHPHRNDPHLRNDDRRPASKLGVARRRWAAVHRRPPRHRCSRARPPRPRPARRRRRN